MTFLHTLLLAFWSTTLAMAPWLLFGFLAAGLLSLFFTPEKISHALGRKAGKRAILLSVLLGVPLPLCSCGVLPTAIGLRKSGASKGATAAFLISTPQTGIDSFFATGSLLGWVFALTRPIIATLTGLIGGYIIETIDHEPTPQALTAKTLKGQQQGLLPSLIAALRYGYGMLFGNVAWALLCGILISALIMAFVPNTLFSDSLLGNDWIAFPLMLLIGIPMYVCSTASIPVALSLIAKGLSPGAALIFLIVGPALNGASLTVLLRLLGKTCTFIHLTVIATFALIAGLLINLLSATTNLLPAYTNACNCASHTTTPLQILTALLLLILLLGHILNKILRKLPAMNTPSITPDTLTLTIHGMMCDHCRNAAQKLLSAYPTVTHVERISPDTFRIQGTLPDTLKQDIEDLGFTL